MDRPVITTIGHGDRAFGEIEPVLRAASVSIIVDVRSIPYSRHAPDFAKDELEALASESGLGYRWIGDRLGGRPSDPALLGPDGRADLAAMRASTVVRGGLSEVAALAATGSVVLLCAEARPDACHRARLLAPMLEEDGYRVVHLLHDGTSMPHQPELTF